MLGGAPWQDVRAPRWPPYSCFLFPGPGHAGRRLPSACDRRKVTAFQGEKGAQISSKPTASLMLAVLLQYPCPFHL